MTRDRSPLLDILKWGRPPGGGDDPEHVAEWERYYGLRNLEKAEPNDDLRLATFALCILAGVLLAMVVRLVELVLELVLP